VSLVQTRFFPSEVIWNVAMRSVPSVSFFGAAFGLSMSPT